MSNTTYSREFLRGLPDLKRREMEQQRREAVDHGVNQAAKLILHEAQAGNTEWEINLGQLRAGPTRATKVVYNELRHLLMPDFGDDEIVEGFRRKFPDCNITVNKDWVETRPGTRELQTRVTVSWK